MTLNTAAQDAASDAITGAFAKIASPKTRKPRVVIVDDDARFCHLMEYIGLQQGMIITPYVSVDEIDLAELRKADIVVVDYNLGSHGTPTGVSISQDLKRKGITAPLLLVSASQEAFKDAPWADNICGFTSKELGPFALMDSIKAVVGDI